MPRPMTRLREVLAEPETVTGLLQTFKAVLAATFAWWLSGSVLGSELPFLAPWTALLTVHATVHRSLSRGVQTTVSSTIGVLFSFGIGALLGVSVWTFALAVLVGLLAARIWWIRDEGVAIATTAIFVLGSGFGDQHGLLLDRILEVALGVAVGVVVNLLLVPPLRERQAARYVDSINRRMGRTMIEMAEAVATSWDAEIAESWMRETEAMSQELDSAWATVSFARESERGNPRSGLQRRGRRRAAARDASAAGSAAGEGLSEEPSCENILSRIDEGISHLRHLARTLREGADEGGEWESRFREEWSRIVRDTGSAIEDPDAEVEPVHERLTALAARSAQRGEMPEGGWPFYGSLLTSMRHIAVIVDDVASARDARRRPTRTARRDSSPAEER